MSGDRGNRGHNVRRPRVVQRPAAGPGPLGELKDLLYQLYLEAGPPTLQHIAALIAADDNLPGAPEKDTIARCLGSRELPANQFDVIAIATVLARDAGWDPHDAAARARALWVQARLNVPAGRPLSEFTDPFALEVHRPIEIAVPPGAAELPILPPYVRREHDAELAHLVRAAVDGRSGIAVLVGGSSTGKTRACWQALELLQDQKMTWRLWHPIDPSRPDAALRELAAVGPRTVVWLNERPPDTASVAAGRLPRLARCRELRRRNYVAVLTDAGRNAVIPDATTSRRPDRRTLAWRGRLHIE